MKAIDSAGDTRPGFAAMKSAGVTLVGRYFGSSSWKCAGKAECDALKHAGFDIFACYETTSTMMVDGGYAGGVKGAKAALAGIVLAGGPSQPFVYFACDTDTSDTAAVNRYLDGAASVLGSNHVGIYGSYAVCAAALKGHAAKAWQTVAWSGGKHLASAVLYQHAGQPLGNLHIDYDYNDVLNPDVGQWGKVAPVTGAKNWYLGVELGDDVKMNAMIASAKVRGDLFFGGAVPLNTPDARDVDALAALLVRYCTDAAFKAEVDKL